MIDVKLLKEMVQEIMIRLFYPSQIAFNLYGISFAVFLLSPYF